MPVEFLSDEQAASFGRFVGDPSRADLERFFYLDDTDREMIIRRRGDHNRLGFAVQVGTVLVGKEHQTSKTRAANRQCSLHRRSATESMTTPGPVPGPADTHAQYQQQRR